MQEMLLQLLLSSREIVLMLWRYIQVGGIINYQIIQAYNCNPFGNMFHDSYVKNFINHIT